LHDSDCLVNRDSRTFLHHLPMPAVGLNIL
jgi:hypothetical protein